MREKYIENNLKDKNLQYRGEVNTRLNNLTDAVFGIALALLIFNVSDADSFKDLIAFAKSFPALLVSIIFIYIVWKEHVAFSVLYGIQGVKLQVLNILFTSLIIFYVYPLRFLTKLLTNMFFNFDIELEIETYEIPQLMIFYGTIALAIYLTLYLFYVSVLSQKKELALNEYEVLYTREHRNRMLIMAVVPFISVCISCVVQNHSILWASVLGGAVYGLYPIFIELWRKGYNRKKLDMRNVSD